MHEAKVRSYYFADLASRYASRRQWVLGLSFAFAASSAFAVLAELDPWVPGAFAAGAALLTGYALVANLDQKIRLLGKLHTSWNGLSNEYELLRQHWADDEAETTYAELLRRAAELSQEAVLGAPYKRKLVARWEEFVYAPLRKEETAA